MSSQQWSLDAMSKMTYSTGQELLLHQYLYELEINPNSAVWRLAFRFDHLQEQPDGTRHQAQEQKLLFFGPGSKNSDEDVTTLFFDHAIENGKVANYFKVKNYVPLTTIKLRLQYIPEKFAVMITCIVNKDRVVYKYFTLGPQFSSLTIIAPEKTDVEAVSGKVTRMSLQDISNNTDSFRVGNVTFRFGNMFEPEVLAKTNCLLLPASSQGNATVEILNKASEFDIPFPVPVPPGEIRLFELGTDKNVMTGGYAYTVNDNESSLDILQRIFKSLNVELNIRKGVKGVNLPLLGTGAGHIKPVKAAEIAVEALKGKKLADKIYISILTPDIFKAIKHRFQERYVALAPEVPYQKPQTIIDLELALGIQLERSEFQVDRDNQILGIDLSRVRLNRLDFLEHLTNLRTLNLSSLSLADISVLKKLTSLKNLYLSKTMTNYQEVIGQLTWLRTLDLSHNELQDISFLSGLTALVKLQLRSNMIRELEPLKSMSELNYLDLSNNQLTDVKPLEGLIKLQQLNLSYNRINSIYPLKRLNSLHILLISHNEIRHFEEILFLKKLSYLKADKNAPEFNRNVLLDESDNHLTAVRNYELKKADADSIDLNLPAKVLLIGNHASGKSSLLHYLLSGDLKPDMDSTHIIRISKYPQSRQGLPDAIFFDFGGQDYYHGLYRAFMSGGSLYAILWHKETNQNKERTDSRKVVTQDFSLNYWLWQKKYLEQEKFRSGDDPVILIQSHADSEDRATFNNDNELHHIENEFFLTLKHGKAKNTLVNEHALSYLKAYLDQMISENKKSKRSPRWYSSFINYILHQNASAGYRSVSLDQILPNYGRPEEDDLMMLLKDDLDQLHKQGLLLYYQDIMPDCVWLNPAALVQYIHDHVLAPSLIGLVSGGEVAADAFKTVDNEIIQLLLLQKVMYLHKQTGKYIIPSFLPLISEEKIDFELLTFGLDKPLFVLKFENFLPFGLINQTICFFGDLQSIKRFWRDQLLFTINGEAKVLIKIDSQLMEIKVYAAYKETAHPKLKDNLTSYLFYAIMGLYWDLELLGYSDFLEFQNSKLKREDYEPYHPLFSKIDAAFNFYNNEACRPLDLFLSLDNKQFIRYKQLCDSADDVLIATYNVDTDRNLHAAPKQAAIFSYQPFTSKVLKRPRKAVISYSKKDLHLVNKFKDFLVPLADDGILEDPWYCTELIAGTEWNSEIQRHFDAADIVFFMVSENLLATKYVKDHEIKNAIDRWDNDESIKIVPILLVPYQWTREGKYDLGRFSALPYTAMPVTSFPDQKLAWNFITQAVRIMINNDLYPGTEAYRLNGEMTQLMERIMNWRTDPDAYRSFA